MNQLLKTRFAPQFHIDGVALIRSPFSTGARGENHDVDLLVGANADEGRWFLEGIAVGKGNLNEVLGSHFPPSTGAGGRREARRQGRPGARGRGGV